MIYFVVNKLLQKNEKWNQWMAERNDFIRGIKWAIWKLRRFGSYVFADHGIQSCILMLLLTLYLSDFFFTWNLRSSEFAVTE